MNNCDNNIEILAEFFKAKNLNELAWFGISSTTNSVYDFLSNRIELPKKPTLRLLTDEAFKYLEKQYRTEYVYKSYVLRKKFVCYSPKTSSLYFEFPIGLARADILLVNGKATVFEIKTQYDNYTRLNKQIQEYYKCFSDVSILAHPKDKEMLMRMLPDYVGISSLAKDNRIQHVRKPISEFAYLDQETIFSLLHQSERKKVILSNGYKIPEVHPALQYEKCLNIFMKLSIDKVYYHMIALLRDRQPTSSLIEICSYLPESLHSAVFSYHLRKKDWLSLIEKMDLPIPVS